MLIIYIKQKYSFHKIYVTFLALLSRIISEHKVLFCVTSYSVRHTDITHWRKFKRTTLESPKIEKLIT